MYSVINRRLGVIVTTVLILTLSLTASHDVSQYVSADDVDLVVYLPFEEESGDLVVDFSGHGNDGVLQGGAVRENGLLGQAVSLDGVDDSIQFNTTTGMNISNSFTISLWLYISNTTSLKYFLYHNGFGIFQSATSVGLAVFLPSTNNAQAPVPLNEWFNFVGTYDGAYIRAYVNGEFISSKLWNGTVNPGEGSWKVGEFNGQYWNGKVDELKIWKRVLSDTEIADNFGLDLWSSGHIIHLPMDENSGSTTYDVSGNGYDGILNGTTWVPGNLGSALEFDGVNDMVTVPYHIPYDPTHLTVSLWVKIPASTSLKYFVMEDGWGIFQSGDAIGLAISTPSTNNAASVVPVNEWVHFVGTYNGTTISVYINGVLSATKTWVGSMTNGSRELVLGFFNNAYWQGSMDELEVWNTVLSEQQVARFYATFPVSPPSTTTPPMSSTLTTPPSSTTSSTATTTSSTTTTTSSTTTTTTSSTTTTTSSATTTTSSMTNSTPTTSDTTRSSMTSTMSSSSQETVSTTSTVDNVTNSSSVPPLTNPLPFMEAPAVVISGLMISIVVRRRRDYKNSR